MARHHRTRGTGGTPAFTRSRSAGSMEALESRTLMASNFAFVGVIQGQEMPTQLQWGEGVFNDDGTVSGTYRHAGFGDAVTSSPLPYDMASFLSGGRFTVEAGAGKPAITAQFGSNPLASRGYGVGSLSIEYDTLFGEARNDAWMIETSAGFDSWLRTHRFRAVRLTGDGYSIVEGSVTPVTSTGQDPTHVTWTVGNAAPVTKTIASLDADGTITLTTGEVIVLGRAGVHENTFALVADLDSSDGEMLVGIGAADADFTYGDSAGVWGVYRGLAMTGGAQGSRLLGADVFNSAPVVIDVSHTGAYSIYDGVAYDAGQRTPVSGGTWRVSRSTDAPAFASNRLILTETGTGISLVLVVSPDQQWVFETVRNPAGTPIEFVAGAMRVYRPSLAELNPDGMTVSLENGRPVVYQIEYTQADATSYVWNSLDLIARAGGKPLRTVEIVEQGFSNGEHVVAGIATDGDVLVWERDFRGDWLFRNLTQAFASQGAAPIASDGVVYAGRVFQTLDSSSGNVPVLFIAGKHADGDLVTYAPGATVDDFGVQSWTFTNISDTHLAPNGDSTPVWERSVIGYGTGWGGQNIAGLNAAGEIVVAWTAPGLSRWYVSNLSQIAGTPALAGSLMAYTTLWDAIHVNGLTQDGHLVVTWWAPANVDQWYTNDLTAQFSGPILPPQLPADGDNTLVFYANDLSLNVAGFDSAGNVAIYWWFPGLDNWLTANLTAAVPADQRPVSLERTETFRGYSDNGVYLSRQNIYGRDASGDFVRLYWEQGGPDVWRAQDITDIAVPLP